MKKSAALDAVVGLALTLVVLAAYLAGLPLLESAELKLYDMRSKLRQNLAASDDIVLVAIDDASIAGIGRWPWPRSRLAAMVDRLAGAGAKVVGLDVLLSEPEYNPGLAEIRRLQERYHGLVSAKSVADRKNVFGVEFSSAIVELDSDSRLEASLRGAGNVVLPMFFAQGGKLGAEPEELPASISSFTISYELVSGAAELPSPDGVKAAYPILRFASACASSGHISVFQDFDGVLRREAPVLRYGDAYFPSYAIALALAYSGLGAQDAVFVPGRELRVGKTSIPLDESSRMLITYNGPEQTFQSFSFQDVMNDKVSPEAFKDKIVIVGPTALGVATLFNTPLANNFPPIEMTANVIENVLRRKFLVRPAWAQRCELALLLVVGLFAMFLLPRLRALPGLVISLALLVGMTGAGTYLFVNGDWIKLAYPSALLALAYLVVISKRFFVTEKGKELVEASAIETNKMLGLSFQGQGMLDMAFEKFRLCPLDDNMKETLYNLALDFERKRQFAKAAAVLGHIEAKEPKYKDVAEKIQRLKAASEGAVFGSIGGAKKEGTVVLAGGSTKPTLGRYEIEKELGRGAMGIVYLGRDPKINRQVAIKTMALEEGGDAAAAKQVKERFFREAESAGTLNHPGIVRIFDAGEEQDVAYIAMELLDGQDFTRFTVKEGLRPIPRVLDYVAAVADALDYAHAQGIVHRDIKPANLMLLKDGTVRVADFGIARIAASSKTATGTVLGTPSYMSPEQVAGKKVDGRSDLFSLSVALYEMLTGEKPFKGGEGIGTLLFQIANDPHPDPRTLRPDLPAALAAILDKGLAKDPERRYGRGAEFAAELRAARAALAAGATSPTLELQPPAAVLPAARPEAAPEPAAPPAPASGAPGGTIRLPPPGGAPPQAAPNPDATMPLPPAQAPAADPDATVRIAPAEKP
ncbi:MAG: serine/threonine-protein kinase [Elusimicrobia bacterium]|nr:serine/threonine-protein kinase [Elusimicrobiota bacterium]